MMQGENRPGLGGGLRERTIPELFEATFMTYRDHFQPLILWSLLLTLPAFFINQALAISLQDDIALLNQLIVQNNPQQLAAEFNRLIGPVILFGLGTALIQAALFVLFSALATSIVSEGQFGKRLTLVQAWAEVRPRLGPLALAYVMLLGLVIAISLVLGFVAVLFVPVFLLFLPLIYFAITTGVMMTPAAILERLPAADTLWRAHVLGRAHYWRLLGLLLALNLVVGVLSSVVQWLLNTLTGGAAAVLISAGLSILALPISPIVAVLLYYDVRLRSEALEQGLAEAGPGARPKDVPALGGPQWLKGLTNEDLNYMLGTAGLMIAILVLFVCVITPLLAPMAGFGGF